MHSYTYCWITAANWKVSQQVCIQHATSVSIQLVVTTSYVCANCTEGNYGWMLNIVSEFQHAEVPVILTLFPESESIIIHKIKKGHSLHQLACLCSQ